MHPDASEMLLTAIALCLAEIPLFAYFGYYLYSRHQIRLLELTLTIAASTVPMGLLLCLAYPEVEPVRRPILFPAVGLCVAVVFLGALIGLSWIRRLAIQGTWPRLGLLALGWISIPGFFGFMLGMVWGLAPQSGKPVPLGVSVWWAVVCAPIILLVLYTEHRCGRRCPGVPAKPEADQGYDIFTPSDPTLNADVHTRISARHFPPWFYVGATLFGIGALVAILTNGPGGPPYAEALAFVMFGGAGIMVAGLRVAIRKAQLDHEAADQSPAGSDENPRDDGCPR